MTSTAAHFKSVAARMTHNGECFITQDRAIIADFASDFVIADKGYDADACIAQIQARRAPTVIPPHAHRKEPRQYDQHLYRERHLVK